MDKQQIFDTVATHLLKQGKPALSAEGFCRYRTDGGLKCAVGVLISDDKYDGKMEGESIYDRKVQKGLPFPVTEEDVGFLRRLQSAHDIALKDSGIEAWKEQMRLIAAENGLNAEVLDVAHSG